jgi:hypothetical protein
VVTVSWEGLLLQQIRVIAVSSALGIPMSIVALETG